MNTKAIFILLTISLIALNIKTQAQPVQELEQAYAENSTKKLKQVLDNWANEIKPITEKEIAKMSEIEREAYNVFEAYYNPHDLASRGGSDFGNDAYLKFNYFLVQNQLNVHQADKVYYTEPEIRDFVVKMIMKKFTTISVERRDQSIALFLSRPLKDEQLFVGAYGPHGSEVVDSTQRLVKTITNFRPRMIQTKATPLYLNAKYDEVLQRFPGDEPIPAGQVGIKKLDTKKKRFLENYVKVYDYRPLTPPTVGAVIFDKDMEYAMIRYGMIMQGGIAFLKKESGKWVIISAKNTSRE